MGDNPSTLVKKGKLEIDSFSCLFACCFEKKTDINDSQETYTGTNGVVYVYENTIRHKGVFDTILRVVEQTI